MGIDRLPPWHDLGFPVNNAKDLKQALQDTDLDWLVVPKPVFYGENKTPAPKSVIANVRSNDNHFISIVSDKYKIMQNEIALGFVDHMIPLGLELITGGNINDRKIYLTGKFGSFTAGGDDIDMYLVFTNSHDGKGSVRICITPVRVLCQNALSLAFSKAERSWAVTHVGSVEDKLHTVESTLQEVSAYTKEFQTMAGLFSDSPINSSQVENFLDKLIPIASDASVQVEKAAREKIDTIRDIYYNAPDIKGRNNKWAMLNAVSDYATHYPSPFVDEYKARMSTLHKVIKGHPLIDRAFTLLKVA